MKALRNSGLFVRDRILRDERGKPIGRVILAGEIEVGKRIPVVLLEVPRSIISNVIDNIYYLDGIAYKIQEGINRIKVRKTSLKHLLNNFYLEPVEDGTDQ